VARDPKVAWQTALWFWMTSSGAGSRNCHDGITGGHGFGSTIRTINGGLECDGKNPGTVKMRVDAYNALCKLMGVEPGANTGC
jgi:chitinase